MKFENASNRVWGNLYLVKDCDSEVTLQEAEVESLHKWTREELEAKIAECEGSGSIQITPDSIQAFKTMREKGLLE